MATAIRLIPLALVKSTASFLVASVISSPPEKSFINLSLFIPASKVGTTVKSALLNTSVTFASISSGV